MCEMDTNTCLIWHAKYLAAAILINSDPEAEQNIIFINVDK